MEAKLLSPSRPSGKMLPGDTYHVSGQNPKIGSSIEGTQHTQIQRGCLADHPILMMTSRPWRSQKLESSSDAILDIVPVGQHEDAVMLKIVCEDPTSPPIVKLLVDLRLELLLTLCGGEPRNVDFAVKCLPTGGDGRFGIIFVPISQLAYSKEDGHYTNPLTGCRSVDESELPVCKIDFGTVSGIFLVDCDSVSWSASMRNGEKSVRGAYNFSRLPGARKAMEAFMKSKGYFDGAL